jgi:hypothetical protein
MTDAAWRNAGRGSLAMKMNVAPGRISPKPLPSHCPGRTRPPGALRGSTPLSYLDDWELWDKRQKETPIVIGSPPPRCYLSHPPMPLPGTVGRGLARRFRSKFVFPVGSLFRLRVSHHLDHAAFPAPASSNAACGFPRTALSCLLRPKAYGTYPAGATFGAMGRTLTLLRRPLGLVLGIGGLRVRGARWRDRLRAWRLPARLNRQAPRSSRTRCNHVDRRL